MTLWISPSKIAFVYAMCNRCTWLHFRDFKSPTGSFEEFNLMDRSQKAALPKGTRLDRVGIPGAVAFTAGKVCSVDYGSDGVEARIFGEYDIVAELDEGGFAVIDLKSGKPNEEKRDRYQKQLSAYALAMIEPDRHKPIDIRAAYLLHCWPTTSTFVPDADPPAMMMDWRLAAVHVPIDIEEAREGVAKIIEVASLPEMPRRSSRCEMCGYVARVGQFVLSQQANRALQDALLTGEETAEGPVAAAQRELARHAPGTDSYKQALAALGAAQREVLKAQELVTTDSRP